MSESPGTVLGLFELFWVHQDDKFGFCFDGFDVGTQTQREWAIAAITRSSCVWYHVLAFLRSIGGSFS